MRIISRKDVENSLTMREAIEVVKNAFIELSNGTAIVPPRIHLSIEKERATTLVMPAYLSQTNALACKIVSVFPHNSNKNLSVIYGLVTLFSHETGEPLAIIEGASLTVLRTGAASGLATDLFARQDAKTLAIFGAGVQSKTQIEAVCEVRKIEKIYVHSRRKEKTKEFINEMQSEVNAEFIIADSSQQAVNNADIICTATSSYSPVFDGNDLKDGTHINGVGSYKSQMQEIDFATLKRCSKIIVDSREDCFLEAGDLVQAVEQKKITETDIYAEIGEIAAGLKKGREHLGEITFFKSVGNAVQDAAIGQAIYQAINTANLGLKVDL